MTTEPSPLTEEDIAFVVEHVVASVEDRWIEKGILNAPDGNTANAVAKGRCGLGGFALDGYHVDWTHGKIEVEAGTRRGVITFAELASRVRKNVTHNLFSV